MGIRRRTVLGAAAAASLFAVTGCSTPGVLRGDSDAILVAVPWSGPELAAFHHVLDSLDWSGRRIAVVPLGEDIDTVLHAPGTLMPDIVVLPQPYHITELLHHPSSLHDLTDLYAASAYSPQWDSLIRPNRGSTVYAIPFKMSNKSLVWYDSRRLRAHLGTTISPDHWQLDDWIHAAATLSQSGIPLLALSAADGWALAYLFENVLLAVTPSVYRELESSGVGRRPSRRWSMITDALTRTAQLWGASQQSRDAAVGALTLQFSDAVQAVFAADGPLLVCAPDYAEPIAQRSIADHGGTAQDIGLAAFPASGSNPPPLLVGGDFLTVSGKPRSGRQLAEVLHLVELLAGPAAPQPWISDYGGFVSPRLDVSPNGYSPLLRKSARSLADWRDFDLSDRVGGGAGPNGLWRALPTFLTDSTAGHRDAVRNAVALLTDYDKGLGP